MFSRSRQAAVISSMSVRSRALRPSYVKGISTGLKRARRCSRSGATVSVEETVAASRIAARVFMTRDLEGSVRRPEARRRPASLPSGPEVSERRGERLGHRRVDAVGGALELGLVVDQRLPLPAE